MQEMVRIYLLNTSYTLVVQLLAPTRNNVSKPIN